MVYIWREQTRVKWVRAEVFSSHRNTWQQATQRDYIFFNTKMAIEHSKVVFIAILQYSREQWFCPLVIHWNPLPPPPLSLFPPSRFWLSLFFTCHLMLSLWDAKSKRVSNDRFVMITTIFGVIVVAAAVVIVAFLIFLLFCPPAVNINFRIFSTTLNWK